MENEASALLIWGATVLPCAALARSLHQHVSVGHLLVGWPPCGDLIMTKTIVAPAPMSPAVWKADG